MRLLLLLSLCVLLSANPAFAQTVRKGTKSSPAIRRPAAAADDEEQASPEKSDDDTKSSDDDSDEGAAGAKKTGREDADDDGDAENVKKPGGLKVADVDDAKLSKHFSYIQGYQFGQALREAGLEFDEKTFGQAIDDALAEKEPDMSPEDMQATLQTLQKLMQQKQASRLAEMSRKNKKEEEAFLAANKKEKGVKALPSGMQYKVLKSGNGKSPKANDTVKVDYEGTLLDGKKFDSSYDRGEPIVMRVDQFIPGWKQALPLMKVGDQWELFIPSVLAYGQQGNQVIPPNSLLKFKLELLDVNPKASSKSTKSIKP